MSFFNAIANFKIALLEALAGSHSPHKGYEHAKPQRPTYGNPGNHHHRPHSSQPGHNRPQSAKPVYGTPHTHPVTEHQFPTRPVYPIYSLSR